MASGVIEWILLTGTKVTEFAFYGAGISHLDSIAEFRILTKNFDAEYGTTQVGN